MEGKFPIYINLREFSQYSDDSKLGLVSYFLIKKYQIDISEEYYKIHFKCAKESLYHMKLYQKQ